MIPDSESSGSKSDESVLGRADLVFTYRGIRSSLTVNDLAKIRRKYDFLRTFSVAVPEAFTNAYTYELGFTTLYEDALASSLHLPLHPLAWDLLIYLGITLGQLAPNSW